MLGSCIKHKYNDGSVHLVRRSERQKLLAASQTSQTASPQQHVSEKGAPRKVVVVLWPAQS